jgi:hypothetical protein
MATTTFNNLITFSRGSNATVTGPNGLIQWAPSNLLTNSQDFEASAWTKISATVTANSSIAPDSSTTADTITASAASSGHYVFQSVTTVAGAYTFTTYAKYANNQWVALRIFDGTSSYFGSFDIQNGVAGAKSAAATTAITPVGNGWYRIAVTATVLASASSNVVIALNNSDSASIVTWTATGTETAFIWGAQLELGSTATTYNNTSVRNLLGFSEAFDNAAWTKVAASVVTGAQANPVNGLFNAQKLMENTAASEHRTYFTIITAPNTYTYSVYLKAAERTFALLTHLSVTPQPSIVVNLTTGAVTSPTNVIASGSVNVGNGWWRVWMTYTTTTTTTSYPQVSLFSSATTGNYTGDGNSGVYIYGAMLSNSASLDPYVPTPGAAPSSTAYYGPRFDYDPVTLLPRGLLVEEARTNLLLRSQEFDNAAYTNSNVTVTANAIAAPDGTTTADLLAAASTASVNLQQSSAVAATSATYSIFVKKGSGATQANAFRLRNTTTATTLVEVTINYDTGVLTYVTGSTGATSVNFGNGWWRVVLTATTGITSGDTIRCDQCFVGASTVGHSAYVWGAQLEAGAFATSYIPTIASTVTRSADVATITGSLFSQWYNQSEGAFIGEASFFGLGQNPSNGLLSASNNTFSESISVFRTGTANNISTDIIDNSVTQASFVVAMGVQPVKAAITYALNNSNFALNGTAQTTDTSCTTPSPDRLFIGSIYSGGSFLTNGHIRSIRYVPVRAADFQLQQVTT